MPDPAIALPAQDIDVCATIVRACRRCSGPRQEGTDCQGCGLAEPPEIISLGVIAAQRTDRARSAWWNAIGSRLADRRIRKANREMCG